MGPVQTLLLLVSIYHPYEPEAIFRSLRTRVRMVALQLTLLIAVLVSTNASPAANHGGVKAWPDAPLARQPRQFGWLTSLFGGSGSGSGSRGRLQSASESIRQYGAPASCHPAHNCIARGQDYDSCCRGYGSCKICKPRK